MSRRELEFVRSKVGERTQMLALLALGRVLSAAAPSPPKVGSTSSSSMPGIVRTKLDLAARVTGLDSRHRLPWRAEGRLTQPSQPCWSTPWMADGWEASSHERVMDSYQRPRFAKNPCKPARTLETSKEHPASYERVMNSYERSEPS